MTNLADVYQKIAERIVTEPDREIAMQQLVDHMWRELERCDVSWLGFYIDQPDEPEDRRMILGPHRNKPACSPIGLHGVCGQAMLSQQPRIVDDVHSLGSDYVVCDPRDRAELVIPLFDGRRCWGVIDLDSYTPGRFTDVDQEGVQLVLAAAGFRHLLEDTIQH